MKKILINFLILSFYSFGDGEAGSLSLDKDINEDRKISFPNTKEYLVIVSDLHTHSVFSDGHVWPNIRVEEALRDGLDVLAITEHLEYQPHIEFLPNKDRNDAYEEAKLANKNNFTECKKNDFFYSDLEECNVFDLNNKLIGKISGIFNFGAGDILEIKINEDNSTMLMNFNKYNFPKISIKKKSITLNIT